MTEECVNMKVIILNFCFEHKMTLSAGRRNCLKGYPDTCDVRKVKVTEL